MIDTEQIKLAQDLVGKFVRFRGLDHLIKPTPILVTSATLDGMINLEGWAGNFAPHLFETVEAPNV